MNMNLKILSAGALFFLGGMEAFAQKTKSDSLKTKDLDDLVIVGYTAVKKEDFTGSVSKVNSQAISNKNISNAGQALAGEAPGVRVITTSGQPGSEPNIRIRGFGSVNGGRDPLYVLDGVPFSGNIASINPDDIETMNVLKDATATAVYGARGANGVILITTKRGRSNRDQITLESKIGFNAPLIPRYSTIKSPEQYIGLAWEAMYNYASLQKAAGVRAFVNVDPETWANSNLFSNSGINSSYNLWNQTGADLIDPTTRSVRASATRRYDPENWEDYAFQTSVRTEHNLNISGGSGKTTYYSGIGYLKDEGYSINSKYERYTGRLNVSHQAKSWLKGEFNLGYAFSNTDRNGQTSNSGSVFWFVDNIPSIYPLFLRDANGNKVADPYYGGYQYDYGTGRGFGAMTNAVADATYNQNNRKKHEMNANFFLKADLLKGLSFETRLGGQYYNNNVDLFVNPYYGSAASQNGMISKTKYELFSWNFLQMLRYMKRFDKHNIQAFVAHESNDWKYSVLSADKSGLVVPDGTELKNAITMVSSESYIHNYALESYFAQFIYDYNNKYLFQANVRRDGSSRFLQNKWDNFYSLGLGWVVSKENFLKDNKYVNHLKLRASYGTVGSQSLVSESDSSLQNTGYYPGYSVYNPGNFMGLPAAAFSRIGYPNLTWEVSKMFQTGIDFTLFNRRIEGTVDYYHKTTDNLIFDNRVAPSTGNALIKVNDGLMVNQGIEFALTGHIINKENFFLDLSVNGEWFSNTLTKMPTDFTTGKEKIIDLSESNFGRTTGRSLYDFYMREWAGVNPDTGAARWVVHYVDANNNNAFDAGEQISSLHEYMVANPNADVKVGTTEVYSQATQKFVNKSAIPDIRGAFSLNTGYKGLSLAIQFLYGIGGYSYDGAYAALMGNGAIGGQNWHTDITNRWQKAGDITDVPRLSNNRDANYNSSSTRFLTKSDYLVLNNVRLSYSLPSSLYEGTALKGLTLSISGDNLWISTKRKGFNPTTSETGASSTYRYSPLSTFTFGVKATF